MNVMMKDFSPARRNALTKLALSIGGLLLVSPGHAAIERGREYMPVKAPQSPESAGKIEVLEFFSYTCPHCFRLEGVIEPWLKRLPADVVFRRVPVSFQESSLPLAQAYYVLDSMGRLDTLHLKIFDAFQQKGIRLDRERTLLEWVGTQGVDAKRFAETYQSFGLRAKLARARQLAQAFEIDSVPSLIVGGKYLTSTELAGNKEAVPKVVDELVALVRKETRERKS